MKYCRASESVSFSTVSRGKVSCRRVAAQPFQRRHDLVSQEAVRFPERGGQHVDGLLARDQRERCRNVPADPDVFFRLAHEVRERVDHRFAVADEHGPRLSLQPPMAQQADERRNEDEVVRSAGADAHHRLVGHFRRRIVEKRDQQAAEARIVRLPDGDRDVAPGLAARSATYRAMTADEGRFRRVTVVVAETCGERGRRRHADARIGIGKHRARECGRVLVADDAQAR